MPHGQMIAYQVTTLAKASQAAALHQEIECEGREREKEDEPVDHGSVKGAGSGLNGWRNRASEAYGMDFSSLLKLFVHAPVETLRVSHFCLPASGTMIGEVPPATSLVTESAPSI